MDSSVEVNFTLKYVIVNKDRGTPRNPKFITVILKLKRIYMAAYL